MSHPVFSPTITILLLAYPLIFPYFFFLCFFSTSSPSYQTFSTFFFLLFSLRLLPVPHTRPVHPVQHTSLPFPSYSCLFPLVSHPLSFYYYYLLALLSSPIPLNFFNLLPVPLTRLPPHFPLTILSPTVPHTRSLPPVLSSHTPTSLSPSYHPFSCSSLVPFLLLTTPPFPSTATVPWTQTTPTRCNTS